MDFVGVFLNKAAGRPLYQQLYTHLAAGITSGKYPAGARLPGKRTAAAQLGVSVNTVDEAYQMLAAEGYVEARPRSGFRVSRLEQLVPQPPAPVVPRPPREESLQWRFNLSSGGLDTTLFPRKTWNRLMRETLSQPEDLFTRGPAAGDEVLREAIAQYLRGYRGVACAAGDVVVGAGLELLVGMLARALAGSVVAVESPGYARTARILQNEGVAARHIPVDAEGMRPDLLARSGADVAYLTPSHQFPTGGVMPVGRRTELLRWAGDGRLIIEDDYDSEFRFDGRPLPSLQGLDRAGSVVYAGTFSRSLAPGLRAAYLVLPASLRHRWADMYGDYACSVSRPDQHTLARLMAGGHFSRSVNRARAVYKKRRDTLMDALEATLARGSYEILAAHTGLYFLLELKNADAARVAQKARQAGIRLRAVAEYRQGPPPKGDDTHWNALIIGYGGLADESIAAASAALAGLLAAGA